MKVGRFESSGQNQPWAFNNEWAIDLNAAYRGLLTDKGQTDPYARTTAEIPLDLISFIQHADISLSAAKEPLDYVHRGIATCLSKPEFLIALGGGSVIDGANYISATAFSGGPAWDCFILASRKEREYAGAKPERCAKLARRVFGV